MNLSRRQLFQAFIGGTMVLAAKPVEALLAPITLQPPTSALPEPVKPAVLDTPRPRLILRDGAELSNAIVENLTVEVQGQGVMIRSCLFRKSSPAIKFQR